MRDETLEVLTELSEKSLDPEMRRVFKNAVDIYLGLKKPCFERRESMELPPNRYLDPDYDPYPKHKRPVLERKECANGPICPVTLHVFRKGEKGIVWNSKVFLNHRVLAEHLLRMGYAKESSVQIPGKTCSCGALLEIGQSVIRYDNNLFESLTCFISWLRDKYPPEVVF